MIGAIIGAIAQAYYGIHYYYTNTVKKIFRQKFIKSIK